MSDEEARAIREEVIRAMAQEGDNVSAYDGADRILERAGDGLVPLLDDAAIIQAAVDKGAVPDGRGEESPIDLTHKCMLNNDEALAAVFADVREQSRLSALVQPARWAALGLVPVGQTAEEFEMYVYEYLEEHASEAADASVRLAGAGTTPAALASKRVRTPKVRTATTAVGMSRFVRTWMQEEQRGVIESAVEDLGDATASDNAAGPSNRGIAAHIVALTGAHSYYLYSRDIMTDTFARWAFLANEDDRVVTFVECVRQESRTYPRPMEARALCNDPFSYDIEEIEAIWEQVRDAGEHPDLETVTASNGDVYYFSTDYLKPAYAASLAEWNSVERDLYL